MSRWRTRGCTPLSPASPFLIASAIITDRCRPPVQPIPIVRYVLPSATYCGIRKRSRLSVCSRNSCVASDLSRNAFTSRSRPVCGRSFGTKCGFGRNRTSNNRSESTGMPCLKPKLRTVTTSCDPGERPPWTFRKAWRSSWTVIADVSTTCAASRRSGFIRSRSSRIPSIADRSGASGCGRRVSLKRRTSTSSEASRKIRTGCRLRIALSRRNTFGSSSSILPSRTSTTTAARAISLPARRVSSASIGSSATGRLSTQK